MLSLTARGGVRATTARLPVACTATARRPPAHGRIAPLQLCAARAQLTAAIATSTSPAASAPVGFGPGSSGNRGSGASGWLAAGAVAVGALTGAVGLSWFNRTPDSELRGVNPPSRPDLPTIPLAEVRKHDTRETGMWCTYRGAVYDATPFLDAHPGGTTRLLMAGGADLAPFWNVYRQHYRGHVVAWMEKYRVGTLSADDRAKVEAESFEFPDAFEDDPKRDSDLLGTTQKPWCGEPRIEKLIQSYYTPNGLFYVRNHLPVPDIADDEWELEVSGNGIRTHTFTLNDLKTKFKKHDVVSTLQCAGNRREDFHDVDRQIFISPHWVAASISNAKWSGVRLRDVLEHCGLPVDDMALRRKRPAGTEHVQFEGYDEDETGLNFGGSIPIDKAVDPYGDVILAYEMNGEPLPRDHGKPVRAVVPGHAGARQVKWLSKVIVSEVESNRPWHQKSYRGFAPDVSFEEHLSKWPKGLRLDQAPIVQEMPVQSLVCYPPPNARVGTKGGDGTITIKGVAWAGGGSGINRVDVSIDGGKVYTAAELFKPVSQGRRQQWAWTQFEKTFTLPPRVQAQLKAGREVKLTVTSKAVDAMFNTQPPAEVKERYYNARGVCINHEYVVPFTLDPHMDKKDHLDLSDSQEHFGNVPTGGHFKQPWRGHGWTAKGGAK